MVEKRQNSGSRSPRIPPFSQILGPDLRQNGRNLHRIFQKSRGPGRLSPNTFYSNPTIPYIATAGMLGLLPAPATAGICTSVVLLYIERDYYS